MNTRSFNIPEDSSPQRLDCAIAAEYEDISRSTVQKAILNGHVTVNNKVVNSKKHQVIPLDSICVALPEVEHTPDKPQAMNLEIVYEDEDLFVINKPSGLTVHPGAGQPDGTLLNAIIAKHPSNHLLPQAGLIHRLDKDTTGLLIIAKTSESYFKLNQAMAKRLIKREYIALVKGVIHKGGSIDAPLARHPTSRQKFTTHPNGRTAITHYHIQERFLHHTLLRIQLETGRTHQIRVHMQSIGYPIIGDRVYNRQTQIKKNTLSDKALNTLYQFSRQALHAAYLTFNHPVSNEVIALSAPLPNDLENLLSVIRSESSDPRAP